MVRLLVAMGMALAMLAGVSTAQAAPALEAYGALPGIDQVELSPSGARYALVGLVEGERRVVVIDNGKPLIMAKVGDLKVRYLEWAGEDRLIVVSSRAYNLGFDYGGKYEIAQAVIVDIPKRALIPVFARGKLANGVWGFYGVGEREGRWYGYFGALTVATGLAADTYLVSGHPDLYAVDLETGVAERAAARAEDGHHRRWLVGPDGTVLANADYQQNTGMWRLYPGKAWAKPLAEYSSPFADVRLLGQGRTPGTLLIARPDADDDDEFFEIPAAGGEPVKLPDQDGDYAPLFDRQTGLLVGMRSMTAKRRLRLFDANQQARARGAIAAFDGYTATLQSWNHDFTRMVVFTEGKDDSGTYWLIDIATQKAEIVGRAYPSVREADVGLTRMVSYKAADGLAMEGVLTLPPGREPKNLPVVVMPHGGPAAYDTLSFDWWAQAFASRGYAVFQPNFRGSTGYGGAFYQAGSGEWGRKMQTDVSDGLAELAKQGIVDPRRACIVGASYGGYAALAGVTLQHGLYRCAVSYAGVADMAAMRTYDVSRSDSYANASTRHWKEYIGPSSTLDDISPASKAGSADAPVLLVHGKDDTVVPYDQSVAMAGALKRRDKAVEFIALPGEDHWLSGEATRTALLKASVAFVEKHNPPD